MLRLAKIDELSADDIEQYTDVIPVFWLDEPTGYSGGKQPSQAAGEKATGWDPVLRQAHQVLCDGGKLLQLRMVCSWGFDIGEVQVHWLGRLRHLHAVFCDMSGVRRMGYLGATKPVPAKALAFKDLGPHVYMSTVAMIWQEFQNGAVFKESGIGESDVKTDLHKIYDVPDVLSEVDFVHL
ncbi:hypothetical protein AK812_SmicGene40272 [Symbiodinium microadriaticum]|uniref:Uncharacterized protein n=1 Tax=Symbiodinium microadriaticum TaxID=2951 RepID=A0A1Q9C973_SYMMI|nr:hypothetical protein AK812_SmicGene40272 [Symbiodinium microadriaticum]